MKPFITANDGSVTFHGPMAIVAFPIIAAIQIMFWLLALLLIIGVLCATPFVIVARWGNNLGKRGLRADSDGDGV